MADESRDPMVEHLLELRRQQTAAHGLAKYLDQQVRTREEILILSGIPVPPPEEGGSRQSGGVQEGAAAPVVEEAALSRETGAENNPPDAGTEETPASARLIRCRLDELRQIPEARQTSEQREEERLLERISACSHQPEMLRVIAKNFGNRILLTDAAILIFNSGRSIVHPRTLAGQLRNNIRKQGPGPLNKGPKSSTNPAIRTTSSSSRTATRYREKGSLLPAIRTRRDRQTATPETGITAPA